MDRSKEVNGLHGESRGPVTGNMCLTNNTFSAETAGSQLLVKLVSDGAKMPIKGTPQSAGVDVISTLSTALEPGEHKLVPTGIAIACPRGTYARIAPRSGLALKHNIAVGGRSCRRR